MKAPSSLLRSALDRAKEQARLAPRDRRSLQKGLTLLSTALGAAGFRKAGYIALAGSMAVGLSGKLASGSHPETARTHANLPAEAVQGTVPPESHLVKALTFLENAPTTPPLRIDGAVSIHDETLLEYIDAMRRESSTFSGWYDDIVDSGFDVRVVAAREARYPIPQEIAMGWVSFDWAPDSLDESDPARSMEVVVDVDGLMAYVEQQVGAHGGTSEEIEHIQREVLFAILAHEFAHGYDVAMDQGLFHRFCHHADPTTGWSCTLERENLVASELGISPSVADWLPTGDILLDTYRRHHGLRGGPEVPAVP